MNFSKQLKKYREQNDLSQEKLAEKIYVTRQTISKWENDKSYPDIHNLIALSVLFDISLDELIKGDVKEMKNQLKDKCSWKRDAWGMLVFIALVVVVGVPSVIVWGWKGFIPMAILWVISMYFAFKLEKVKKQNNLKTYQEIVAFTENKTTKLENLQKNRSQKKYLIQKTLIVIGYTAFFVLLALVTVFITFHFISR